MFRDAGSKSGQLQSSLDQCILEIQACVSQYEREYEKYLSSMPKFSAPETESRKSELIKGITSHKLRLQTLSKMKNNQEITQEEHGKLLEVDEIKNLKDIADYPHVKINYTYECRIV